MNRRDILKTALALPAGFAVGATTEIATDPHREWLTEANRLNKFQNEMPLDTPRAIEDELANREYRLLDLIRDTPAKTKDGALVQIEAAMRERMMDAEPETDFAYATLRNALNSLQAIA